MVKLIRRKRPAGVPPVRDSAANPDRSGGQLVRPAAAIGTCHPVVAPCTDLQERPLRSDVNDRSEVAPFGPTTSEQQSLPPLIPPERGIQTRSVADNDGAGT